MRLHNVDHSHNWRTDNSHLANGASLAHVICCAAIRNHLSLALVPGMVSIGRFSIFKMGKLTQSQKALFLWKSPLAKLQ